MRLILTRHGETEENATGIMQGHLPGKLSKEGIEQAKKLAERLKSEKIDVIYSSDLARSADTAKEIAKHHPDAYFIFTEELREFNLGDYQGKTKSEVGEENLKMRFENSDLRFPNGESESDVSKRARHFFERILKKHKDETVLVVAHNGINKSLISAITGRKDRNYKLDNTNVCIFEIDEDKNHRIHAFNCTKHLE